MNENLWIGAAGKVCVIAELSANHGQEYDKAVELIHAAKDAGADAVKVQTYTPDTLTLDCRNEHFLIGKGTIWEGRTLYDLYAEAFTPWEWQPRLRDVADELGMGFFSTPFDDTAVAFLEDMDVPAYKVASFEVVDIPLLRTVGRTGKPVIMSTGMASETEIREAVAALRTAGCPKIVLLKCTSAYPAEPADANLLTIPDMAKRFGYPVGLSDHTLGIAVPLAAVALGACVIEKHLTLSRAAGGPDAAFSLEPREFRDMVAAVRVAEAALGSVRYGGTEAEEKSKAFRRSLFVVRDVAEGEAFTAENVRSVRPGYGLPPKYYGGVLGKRATRSIERGTPLTRELVDAEIENGGSE